jgi:PhnB protein
MKTPSEIIRACYAAYESKDREALEALLTDAFTFTSPLDDCISFERCWPNSEHLDAFDIENLVVQGDKAFVQYLAHPKGKPPFRNTEIFTLRDGRVTHVDVYFGRETGEAAAQEEIRAVLGARAAAIRQKNVEGVIACFAQDSVRFSLAPPLQSNEPLREEFENWFATFRGPIGCEMRSLSIDTAADLACCHSFNRLTGTKTDGEKVDVWFRATLCLRQIDGRWQIVHVHESVPFHMDGSFKAAVELKPA